MVLVLMNKMISESYWIVDWGCLLDWTSLSQDVGIFGVSRKNLTDEDLRSIISSSLTCRVDHQYIYFLFLP